MQRRTSLSQSKGRTIIERIVKGKLKTFSKDERPSIQQIYRKYLKLVDTYGFELFLPYEGSPPNDRTKLPLFALKSQRQGPAVYIMAGVHGEEPAGPVAIAENVDLLGELGQKIPLVIIPL